MRQTLLEKLKPGFSQEDGELALKVAQLGTKKSVHVLIEAAAGYLRKRTWWKLYIGKVRQPYAAEEQLLAYQALPETDSQQALDFLEQAKSFEGYWTSGHYEREDTGQLPSIFDECGDWVPEKSHYSFPHIPGNLASQIKTPVSPAFKTILQAYETLKQRLTPSKVSA